ncbi:TPA: histidine phosphatase family protein [Streptococcus equi subsp. zooepidemicus]|nr:histidine phosphatase family protein [Streptococcus equi subsp. zooepidemicus]HEL0742367.1 histidine phosphatase family protein [Streptococcus equi subsp. zooepidemicus]
MGKIIGIQFVMQLSEVVNMKLYLARHGETIGNKEQLIIGNTDYKLIDNGNNQALELKKKIIDFECDICYSSYLSRAYSTAEICFGKGNVIKNSHLNEQNFGVYENLKVDDVKLPQESIGSFYRRLIHSKIENGEQFQEVSDRIEMFIRDCIRNQENFKNIFIFSHTIPLSLLIVLMLNIDKNEYYKFRMDLGKLTMIEINKTKVALRFFNL